MGIDSLSIALTAMTTAPPPDPPPAVSTQNTSIPAFPNPTVRGRGVQNAAEALRVLRLLVDGAANGTQQFPYPTSSNDFPLPPLPPIPVPTGVSRRRRQETAQKAERPVLEPPIPDTSPLCRAQSVEEAVEAHNAQHPETMARVHFEGSAILVELKRRAHAWVLVQTLDASEDARDVRVLGVRVFPRSGDIAPPIHAQPPAGPSLLLSERLTALNLSVASFLYRVPHILPMLDARCYRCNKHLSDIDGLPLSTGWLKMPKSKHPGKHDKPQANGTNGGHREDVYMDNENEEEKIEDASTGRWVAWHESCPIV